MVTLSFPEDYRAALEQSTVRDENAGGRIFMRGRDRAALLHRLSTNRIERLKPGEGVRTVLTTPIGRIIDVLTVHVLDDALLLLTSPGIGPRVFGHLRRNIFFQDQVTVEAAGQTHGQLALFGPKAGVLLQALSGADLHNLPLHHTASIELVGTHVLAARRLPIGGQGFTLVVPMASIEAVRAAIETAGAVLLSDTSFEVLRIEHGYGAHGHELSEAYIPLETGLADAISFNKGCYVGQEIIARMESRNRLAKRLMGVRFIGTDATNITHTMLEGADGFAVPSKFEVGGKEAGDLTSIAVSPRYGTIGLAYVRSAFAEAGVTIRVSATNVQGSIIELPFEA